MEFRTIASSGPRDCIIIVVLNFDTDEAYCFIVFNKQEDFRSSFSKFKNGENGRGREENP